MLVHLDPSPGRPIPVQRAGRIAVVAVAVLAASLAVALRRPIAAWERGLTEWFNGAPEWVATALFPVMQIGMVFAPLVVAAGIILLTRDRRLAAATALAGLVAWYVAKGVKAVVDRGRPASYLPGIDIREGSGAGLGFVSGHSAVAAATAVCVIAATPTRWRPVPVALVALVGIARIVEGVHFPADVVGGWAVGTLIGLAAVTLVTRRRGAATTRRTDDRHGEADPVPRPVRVGITPSGPASRFHEQAPAPSG